MHVPIKVLVIGQAEDGKICLSSQNSKLCVGVETIRHINMPREGAMRKTRQKEGPESGMYTAVFFKCRGQSGPCEPGLWAGEGVGLRLSARDREQEVSGP